ncbi:interferon alpha-inducible protein 27, mitochondrial-like [Sciurus carolinensis]|nr:interferon alpha-inducible protein 27, mitochondrial-like [Sciurus carolinensis]
MALTSASMLASSLVTQITSTVTMAKAGGVASGTLLAGLSSQGATLLSQAVLAPVASTVGPLLGSLNVGSLLSGSSAVTLAAAPIGVKAAVVVTGGVIAVSTVPVVLGAMGFTGTGIAASSLAAKMMSITALANGGGVPAGSLVSTLQSVGAAGLSLSSKINLGTAGSALVASIVGL